MPRALLRITQRPFPGQGIVFDQAGFPVDCNGWVWRLNHPVAVSKSLLPFHQLGDISPALLASIAQFIAERIRLVSVDDVRNAFHTLARLQKSEHFRDCSLSGEVISARIISDLRTLSNFSDWRLHYIRNWYRWCARHRLPQFSREVADDLDDLTFGGNEKGQAVLSRDPLQGAFDQLEFIALTARLRSSEASSNLDLDERALLWLSIACGCNPLAYALLREEDYRPLAEHGTGRVYHRLNVPRIKKGADDFRKEFHPEMLNAEIGGWVAKLVERNRAGRQAGAWDDDWGHPLFVRVHPRA